MEQKKNFKERCAEAKKWWKDNGPIILSGVAIFLTGTVFGIVKGAKMNRNYLDCTIESAVDKGVDVGRHDAINNICNRLEDGDEPIRFHNHDTGKDLYIGKVDAPEEESKEA